MVRKGNQKSSPLLLLFLLLQPNPSGPPQILQPEIPSTHSLPPLPLQFPSLPILHLPPFLQILIPTPILLVVPPSSSRRSSIVRIRVRPPGFILRTRSGTGSGVGACSVVVVGVARLGGGGRSGFGESTFGFGGGSGFGFTFLLLLGLNGGRVVFLLIFVLVVVGLRDVLVSKDFFFVVELVV